MSDTPVDKEALFALVDEDPAFLARLVETFLADCTTYMDAIRTAIEEGDAGTLMEEAHGLKGAVANLQAPSAQKAAHRLEEMGRAGELEGAEAALQSLEHEIDRLRTVLKAMVDEL
jgi:HPt (histidine-containing phosphotransfer) domain-containing protein